MAHPAGVEPTTPRFEVWCSIQLSYGCVRRADSLSSCLIGRQCLRGFFEAILGPIFRFKLC